MTHDGAYDLTHRPLRAIKGYFNWGSHVIKHVFQSLAKAGACISRRCAAEGLDAERPRGMASVLAQRSPRLAFS